MKKSKKVQEAAWQVQEIYERVRRLGLDAEAQALVDDHLSQAFCVLSHAGREMARDEAAESYTRQLEFNFEGFHRARNG